MVYVWEDAGTVGALSVRDCGAQGDGVTDDTVAVQRALDNCNGAVYVPPGSYKLSSSLRIRSNTRLFGEGPISKFISIAGFPAYAPFAADNGGYAAYIMLTNADYIGGNTNIRLENLYFHMTGLTSGNNALFATHFRNVTDSHITKCVARGGSDGFSWTKSTRYSVTECFCYGQTNASLDQWDGCEDGLLANNIIDGTGEDGMGPLYGILVTGGPTNYLQASATVRTSSRISIVGNVIRNIQNVGIWLQGTSKGYTRDCLVIGNNISGITTYHGIRLTEGYRALVHGNHLSDIARVGIFVDQEGAVGGHEGFVISNNVINNVAQLVANPHISLRNGARGHITNNVFLGTGHTNCVDIVAGVTDTHLSGNTYTAGSVGKIADAGTGTVYAHVLGAYADDAAASAGGIVVGELYRTGSTIKIRVT